MATEVSQLMTLEQATEIAKALKLRRKYELPLQSVTQVVPGRFMATFDRFDSPGMEALKLQLLKRKAAMLEYSNAGDTVKIIFMQSGKPS